MKKSDSTMSYEQKAELARQLLEEQGGYSKKAIERIIVLSFGQPPKDSQNVGIPR